MHTFHLSPSPGHFGLAVLSVNPFPVGGSGERELAESGLGSGPRKRAGSWGSMNLGLEMRTGLSLEEGRGRAELRRVVTPNLKVTVGLMLRSRSQEMKSGDSISQEQPTSS